MTVYLRYICVSSSIIVATIIINGTTILIGESEDQRDRSDLEAVVIALNRNLPNQLSDEDHEALVSYIRLWNRSSRVPWKEPFYSATEGSPLKQTQLFHGALEKRPWREKIFEDADGKRFWEQHGPRFSRKNLNRAFCWKIWASPSGGCWQRTLNVANGDTAVLLAAMVLGNTLNAKLSDGPCHRCAKWFIARRKGQKCCSKVCAVAINNTVRVHERRAAEHEERVVRARAALKTWKRSESGADWKQFVSKQTGLTPRFLTRALNKGELRAPTGRRDRHSVADTKKRTRRSHEHI